jgi:hypothetical protein
MRKTMIPKELSHSGMEIKVWLNGLGKIAISLDHSISNVFLVDSLDYNLLSVSQLCKMGYNCRFTDIGVTVFRRSDDSPVRQTRAHFGCLLLFLFEPFLGLFIGLL